jgi:trimethylamine--corrinoid protein Co-methyltransferase
VDLIDQVARDEGHYLGTDQSLRMMKTEYFYPHTSDRKGRVDWETNRSLDMHQRAQIKAKEILATHKPKEIPREIDDAIRKRFEIFLPLELANQ